MPKVMERKLYYKEDTPLLTTDKTKNEKKEMETQIENTKTELHLLEESNNKREPEIQGPEGQEMTVEPKEITNADEQSQSSWKETSSTNVGKTSKLKKEVDALIEKEIEKCCLTGISILEQSVAELNDGIAKLQDYKNRFSGGQQKIN
ncbi:uncharacterized protein LOC126248193 [Schistocerca nitens]|uniref:uncharacterized protein LOC126248193 n=1 Tax=Schistocerca nitens TaxID=7011 RepID=UPI002117EB69|nr:uncharacterized protein LOC126248193 [Schistocerca nitens]XP_049804931.1 uncharacterized protein LOC126248193 [Schistocerca nitens]XP_049804932.1 uncharacterized protein LOC126248193 [Schistocerca nitens]